jgi:hypothetical protein
MAGAGFGKKQTNLRPDGAIRKGQIVTTFGAGAMVDLVDQAVLVSGLDFWNFGGENGVQVITEPRLREALAERFRRAHNGMELSVEAAFREPPDCDDTDATRAAGISVLEFPQWFVCQRCRALVRARDGLELKSGRYEHPCGDAKHGPCVPVRFVGACTNGHLQDWPWVEFAHRKREQGVCNLADLVLEEGATGDFSEIVARCRTCNASERLSAAMVKDGGAMRCDGLRPWLGEQGRQECSPARPLRLLVRTASNGYFPQVVSALSVPDKARELADAIASVWDVVAAATEGTLAAFRTIPKVAAALGPYNDAQVFAAIAARKAGSALAGLPLRSAEFQQFLAAPDEAVGDRPAEHEKRYFVRRHRPKGPHHPWGIERVVLAHKLREVRALVGFTRIEPATPDLQGSYDLDVRAASLGLVTNWLPATEVLGEGVFIRLDEKAVRAWEERPEVIARSAELEAGFDAWATRFKPAPMYPSIRFYLVHTLAHLLINAISLECGYAASAIRERIYCAGPDDANGAMAALLLSTGSSGSEGTLGGLVDQGRRLRHHLRYAWDLGRLCSNDPVCARHSPKDDHAERHLEGAACHGCLFIAECSCERFNGFLDRALVVPTLGNPPQLAFFAERP